MKIIKKWLQQLFTPVDISSLAFFRIAFGLLMVIDVFRYCYHGWVTKYWIMPIHFFTYEGFHWVQPWDVGGMYVHFFMIGILGLFMMLGLFYRVSSILMFFALAYVLLLDKTNYLNHFYLIVLVSFILMWLPANRSFSLDALLKPSIKSDTVPYWSLWILQFQIGIVYIFGGIAKLTPDWLQGEPMRSFLSQRTDFPIIGSYFETSSAAWVVSYSGLFLDLFIVPLLLWKKTRLPAVLIVTIFHLMNASWFSIGIFPWFMILATTIYFDTDWFRKILSKWKYKNPFSKFVSVNSLKQTTISPAIPKSQAILWGLGLYCLIQILVPLRHHLYPGNVSWTEEGHRFSWRMKLRNKSATATFYVKDLNTGMIYEEDPHKLLSKRQVQKMISRPDMIRQFAHILSDAYDEKGYHNVGVNVNINAGLNGRNFQALIDPTVDLSKKRYALGPDDWIVPLTTPLKEKNLNRATASK